jgi:hypothetical protein
MSDGRLQRGGEVGDDHRGLGRGGQRVLLGVHVGFDTGQRRVELNDTS